MREREREKDLLPNGSDPAVRRTGLNYESAHRKVMKWKKYSMIQKKKKKNAEKISNPRLLYSWTLTSRHHSDQTVHIVIFKGVVGLEEKRG